MVLVGSYLARKYGFYNSLWYTDVILHTLSGAAFGYLALVGLNKDKVNPIFLILSLTSFAVLGSYFWELWEFSGWHLVPSDMEFYKPELSDSLGDIASGMVGGFLVAINSLIQKKGV